MERLPSQLTDKQRARLKQRIVDLEADHARLLPKAYKRRNSVMYARLRKLAIVLDDLRELLLIDSRKKHAFRNAITTDAHRDDGWEY